MMASLIASAIGTAMSVAASIQQSQAQARQQEYQGEMAKYQAGVAKYQADVQRENAKLAEQQASAERMAGFENAQAERLKTAQLIGRQRALAGASGVAVDMGSFEDVAEDTAGRGEIDAVNTYNKGIDTAYNQELQAWGYQTQAAGTDAQAAAYNAQGDMLSSAAGATRTTGMLSAIGQGIGGIADIGSTWAHFDAKDGDGGKAGKGNLFGTTYTKRRA